MMEKFNVKEVNLKKAFKVHEDYNIEEDFKYPYHLTPYQGCAFQCVYCFNYKRDKYWKNVDDVTGQIVVGANIVDVLRQELPLVTMDSKLPLVCRIGTEAEIYGPAEEKYGLMRGILQEFAKYPGWHIRIPTKSDLVLRDVDLLKKLDCMVPVTLTTMDDSVAKKLEPNAPSVSRRIEVLRELRRNGIRCRIRCEPYIEGISDTSGMEKLAEELGLEEVKVKKLNYFSVDEIVERMGK
jgi:DNA repair photolyase